MRLDIPDFVFGDSPVIGGDFRQDFNLRPIHQNNSNTVGDLSASGNDRRNMPLIDLRTRGSESASAEPLVQPEQQQTLLNMDGFNPEEYTPAPLAVAPDHPHDGYLSGRPPTSLPADGIEGEGWEAPGHRSQNAWATDDVRITGNTNDNAWGSLTTRYTPADDVNFTGRVSQSPGDENAGYNLAGRVNFDVGDGSGHVQIAHDDPNWAGARQRISGGVEVPLGNGSIGFTAGTNLDSDAIQAGAYYRGNHDDGTFRIGVDTSDPTFFGGNPTVTGEFTIRDDGSRGWGAGVFGSFNNNRGLQGGFRVLFGR